MASRRLGLLPTAENTATGLCDKARRLLLFICKIQWLSDLFRWTGQFWNANTFFRQLKAYQLPLVGQKDPYGETGRGLAE